MCPLQVLALTQQDSRIGATEVILIASAMSIRSSAWSTSSATKGVTRMDADVRHIAACPPSWGRRIGAQNAALVARLAGSIMGWMRTQPGDALPA